MDGHDTYTAFRLQITAANSENSVVWDSGIRLAPPRDGEGNYLFEADAYAGCELERGRSYSWRVTMYNAKFRGDAYSEQAGTFLMATPETGGVYGGVGVSVKYFGPSEALAASTVKVEAYASPDFTGTPLARARISATEQTLASYNTANTVNVTLAGIERGTKCYIRAWLDMDAYGETNRVDAFEAWGAACGRNRNPADPYRPQEFAFDFADGTQRMAEVFIEDVDSNGNRLPDTWEMAVNGGELFATAEGLDTIVAGEFPANASLSGGLALRETASGADLSAPLTTLVATTLGTRAGAALALGVSPSKLTVRETASGGVEIAAECKVEGVKVESIGFDADGRLALAVSADTAEAALAGGLFPSATITVAPAQVTVNVYRKATLAEEGWTLVASERAAIDGESQLSVALPEEAAADGSGFFKVVVEE